MRHRSRRAFSAFACLVAGSLAFSSSFLGIYAIERSIGAKVTQWERGIHGWHYTMGPTEPYLGDHPGRDPLGRGGIWSRWLIRELAFANETQQAMAMITGMRQGPPHTLACDAASGPSYPWEGARGANAGVVNSGNGDRLIKLPLFKWKVRGGMTLDMTLYSNSETTYDDELGKGWTWSYDLYINNLTSNPIVHYGDGLAVPYTAPGGGGGTSAGSTGTSGTGGPEGPSFGPSASAEYLPTTYTPPAGIYDTLVQNADSNWTLTKKDKTVYTFNSAGFCTKITDRNGNAITFTLNSSNYVTKITDPTGRYVTINFTSGTNKWSSVVDPLGRTWSFTRNSSDQLTTVTWPSIGDGNTYTDQFGYDSNNCVTSHTDRRGKVWAATFNSDKSIATETNPLSKTWSYSYTSSATTVTDPLSHTTVDNYSSGIQSSAVDESSFSESYTSRDSNFNVKTRVDKNGKTWTATWDSSGNLLTETDPLSHVVHTYTYNSFNELLTDTDALSHETQYTYDSNGNRLTVVNALSKTVETDTYDSYGERVTTKDALNHTTTLAYGTNGDLTSVTDPLSNQTQFAYDGVSRLTSTTDPLSHVEQIAYDNWDRPVTYTHPDSTTTLKSYDACGNLAQVTDENSHSTTYTYDNAGRLTGMSSPKSETESYGYDNANRRTSVTNGRSYTRNYTFTNRGEVATLTMPDSAEEQWAYDGVGHTTSYENPLSQTISYTFDNAGRQTGITYPSGTNPTFSYDNADRCTGMTDATGTTTWGYDNANRRTSLSTPQGNLTYTLDDAGRRTAMTEPAGSWSYSYDNANRLTSETNPNAETTSWTIDAAGRTTGQTFSNGQVDAYSYDNRDRMTSLTHKNSSLSTISAETYTWDNTGNLTAKTVDSNSWSYGYDADDQLTSETAPSFTASYTYDANGNRASYTVGGVTQTYNVDNGDKLTSITTGGTTLKSYTYDAAGRTHTVVTSAGTTTLSYDYEDRMIGITYPSSSTNSFSYNALDTRVGKTDSGGTFSYVRDGADVTSPVLGDGGATYTPGVSQHRSSTTTFENLDYLGSSTRQTNSSQSTTATRSYDAFGNLVASTGAPIGPFGFVGKAGYQEDVDSGLKLLGHRYYDPSTGRFLTRDTAKSNRNWCGYCLANPLIGIDPDGYQESKYTKNGRAWHKVIEDWYKKTYPNSDVEKRLPNGMRPDIIDRGRGDVIEIKPDNPKGAALGVRQVMIYGDELGYTRGIVILYPPGTSPGDFKNPIGKLRFCPVFKYEQ